MKRGAHKRKSNISWSIEYSTKFLRHFSRLEPDNWFWEGIKVWKDCAEYTKIIIQSKQAV